MIARNDVMLDEAMLEDARDRLRLWAIWLRSIKGGCVPVSAVSGYSERMDAVADIDSDEALVIDRILAELKRLNVQVYNTLFLWYYHDEMTVGEVAERLKISAVTFKKWRLAGEYYVLARGLPKIDTQVSLKKSA